MSATGIEVFDTTVQKTNQWLQEIMQELGTESRQEAYLGHCQVEAKSGRLREMTAWV